MARTRQTRTSEPVTVDMVDQLTTKLSEIGVDFVRDAWFEKAPDNYGVVELTGESSQMWADGHVTDSLYQVIVWLYVGDDDDSWAGKVQAKLEALEADGTVDLTHTNNRRLDPQTGKVEWRWVVMMFGPLIRTVSE